LQPAQVLSALNGDASGRERKFYFEDLPNELQNVLRVQLRHPGDVSAVIELPNGFQLYVLRSRSASALSVGALFLPKRSYEAWLAEVASEWKGSAPTLVKP
jgi:hypothetical protein